MEPVDIEHAGPPPRARAPLALAAVLIFLVGGALIAIALRSDDDGDELSTEDGERVSTTTSPSTSTSTTAAPTTTVAPTTTSPPATTAPTTAPAATAAPTTTAKAKPSFTLSPNSGPGGTQVTAAGSGCQGQDAGVGLTIKEPNGQPYTGDGTSAQPDGSWQLPFSIPNGGPAGKWTVEAVCRVGNAVSFSYAPQTFTKTG